MEVTNRLETPPMGSVGTVRSNANLMADLERKIAYQTGGRIRDLRVEEVGDSVILCGRTSTYYIKQLASQIALDEDRSLVFQNTIEVI